DTVEDTTSETIDEPVAEIEEPANEPESIAEVAEPVSEIEQVAIESETEPVAEVEEPVSEPESVAEVEEVASEPVVEVEEPVSEPEPIAEVEEPVTTVEATDTSDEYNPSMALRAFTIAREGFIWFFDRVLAVIAVLIEIITELDWAGYRERLIDIASMVHERIPESYRKPVYGGLIAILLVIPVGMGAFVFFNNGNVASASSEQATNISDTRQVTSNGILSPVFTPTVQQWAEDIAGWTSGTDISPDMFAVVMQLESCGNPTLVSGLFGTDNASNTLADSDSQATIAMERLQSAMARTNGDFAMALAVYADGEIVLTQDFAQWTHHARDMFILGRNIYSQTTQGYTSSPDLNSWLQNTGSVLCTQAQSTRNG
ncbi:MAG: hypothetical protein AAFV93_15530, partial [Chloroflexota bacterium]